MELTDDLVCLKEIVLHGRAIQKGNTYIDQESD